MRSSMQTHEAKTPKTTLGLRPGDYCLIKREDGLSVAFAFLGSVANSRTAFYGGLLAPAFRSEEEILPSRLDITLAAMIHVKCYAANKTPIVGNLAQVLGSNAIDAALAACTDMRVGAVHGVLGHLALLKRAQTVGMSC